jgi:hypothetical protein
MNELNCQGIFESLNRHDVRFILIGGMNFWLRYEQVSTYDVDIWVDSTSETLRQCEKALADMQAEWGFRDEDWGPVSTKTPGWLQQQYVFCLTTKFGALDIFRGVKGLPEFEVCWQRAGLHRLPTGESYRSLSASDMIACQESIPEGIRKVDRINYLRRYLEGES